MGRRGNGEGSVYQAADGRWRGYVDLGYINGTRRRKYVTGRTRKEVAAQLRTALDARDAGTLQIGTGAATVGEWLTLWVETIASRKVRPSTLATYRGYINNRLTPALGHHRLDRLQPEHLEAFYRDADEEGLSAATVLQMHRILSRALKIAHRRGRVVRNVATLVDAPTVQREEVEPLTAEEARRILQTVSDERNAARWSVALALGLRQGEALGLKWDTVDLAAKTISVVHALQRRAGGGLVLVPPKSRAGRRTIMLPDQLVAQLKEHRVRQDRERVLAGSMWHNDNYLFTTPAGRPLDPRNDHRAWRQLLIDASVRPARLHDARHTAATLLLAQGVAPRVAMQILGHSQITLTLGTYSHVVPELAAEAAASMGNALWGPVPKTENEQPTDAQNELAARKAASPKTKKRPTRAAPLLTCDSSVRRQGLEPRTRGLRVRCSAS
jgi:integrase